MKFILSQIHKRLLPKCGWP